MIYYTVIQMKVLIIHSNESINYACLIFGYLIVCLVSSFSSFQYAFYVVETLVFLFYGDFSIKLKGVHLILLTRFVVDVSSLCSVVIIVGPVPSLHQ